MRASEPPIRLGEDNFLTDARASVAEVLALTEAVGIEDQQQGVGDEHERVRWRWSMT